MGLKYGGFMRLGRKQIQCTVDFAREYVPRCTANGAAKLRLGKDSSRGKTVTRTVTYWH
jgi:hypothetical protein